MKKIKVIIQDEAKSELSELVAYIRTELASPQAARSIVKKIRKSIDILEDYPFAGKPLYTITDIGEDYRYLVSGNYLIFYHLEDLEIHVDHILNGRQDYLQKLFPNVCGEENNEEE